MSVLDILWIFPGIISGYIVTTLAESYLHDYIHHARSRFRAMQRKYPRLLGMFSVAFHSHAVVHHHLTFHDHITQFDDEKHRRRVDELLDKERAGDLIRQEDYGTTLAFRSVVLFVAPLFPAIVLALWLLPLTGAIGFLIPVLIYPLMSKVVHRYLHRSYAEAMEIAPPLMRWILGTRYMRYIWRHHWLHHRHPRSNFNLVLGGDWIRGVHRRATAEEWETMRRSGLPME